MGPKIDSDDYEQIKRFLIHLGRGHPVSCIVRSMTLAKGDFVQIDCSPENTYELTRGMAVVVPFERPGLYGKIISDPHWLQLPEGAIDQNNYLISACIPDWVRCLKEGYYRTAFFEILGDGTPLED